MYIWRNEVLFCIFLFSSYRRFRWVNVLCYCGFRLLFQGRLTTYLYYNVGNESVPFATPTVFVMMNTLNIMITIFSYRLIKTDFCGGWKKTSGEYSYDVNTSRAKKFIDWKFYWKKFQVQEKLFFPLWEFIHHFFVMPNMCLFRFILILAFYIIVY